VGARQAEGFLTPEPPRATQYQPEHVRFFFFFCETGREMIMSDSDNKKFMSYFEKMSHRTHNDLKRLHRVFTFTRTRRQMKTDHD